MASLAASTVADIPAAPAGSETGSTASRQEEVADTALRSVAGGERLSSGPVIC
jgi:hypothetical protein